MHHVPFPPLHPNWEETLATLHAYALGVGALPRTHAIAHPRWWHLSLKLRPDGLITDSMSLPDGGVCFLRMDFHTHEASLETSRAERHLVPMTEGLTATAFADRLLDAADGLGLSGEYDRAKFENNDARSYDPGAASQVFDVLVEVERIFARHRAGLAGEVGPIQLWPHGFDLAFEWFGTRTVTSEEHGETREFPSQLNLGFYPSDRPYFYSNPFPFDRDRLVDATLPSGAEWHLEGWEGTILPYDLVEGRGDGAQRVAAYARAVYELVAPTLTA